MSSNTMDLQTTITRRISIRTYKPEPASPEKLRAALHAGEQAEALTGAEMQFFLCTDSQMGSEVKGIIGDYGKIIRAPHYMVLASREGDGYLTDAGYRFEQFVLEATRQDLGTCWVGLMFKEASLRASLGLDPSWRMMVLSPIGIPLEKSLLNRTLRTLVGSKGRKPIEDLFFWEHHGNKLPQALLAHECWPRIFEAARWAPSWKNVQPWRFIVTAREILIYKIGKQNREGKDYHRLDCGIAMCHLDLMARQQGVGGRWELGVFEVPGSADGEPIGKYILEKPLL